MYKPKISIITPNFNYAHFIGQTIESIIGQDYDNWEHIIVNDGSTDNSVRVIMKYIHNYPNRIKLYQQTNQGQSVALNKALKHITGDIVGWINSDDYYVENIFPKIADAFSVDPSIDIVYGGYNVVNYEGKPIKTVMHVNFNYFEAVFAGFGNVLTSNAVFWKNNYKNESLQFNESLISNMDGDYFSRLTYNKKLKIINVPIANFRKQTVSIAGKGKPEWVKIVKEEGRLVFIQSYNRLFISSFVPFSIGKHLKYPVLVYRKLKKFATKCLMLVQRY